MLNVKRLQFLLVISMFLFIGCDDYCELTDYEDYLPLKIGNKWTYSSLETTWEVIGTKEIDGHSFYDVLIEYHDFNGYNSSYHSYYRFEDSKLFKYSESDSLVILFADFSLKEGEVFHQINTGFNVTVWSDNPNEFEFYYDHPEWADEDYAITFRIGVGIISNCSIAWGGCDNLVEYDIN